MRTCRRYPKETKLQALAEISAGCSFVDVAKKMEIPVDTVKTWYYDSIKIIEGKIDKNKFKMTADELNEFQQLKKIETNIAFINIKSKALTGLEMYVNDVVDSGKVSRADAQTMITAVGVISDKQALLNKEPTQIIEGTLTKFEDFTP